MDSIRSNSSGRPLWLIIVAGVGVGYMLWSLLFSSSPVPGPLVTKAVAVLSGDVSGTVSFIQSSPTGPVKVTGQLTGLAPDAQRGFHIHALGDLTNGCTSTSSHYNPLGMNHGAPTDSARHVGDLGNIATDSNGVAKLNIEDKIISLNGLQSIIGRAVVVHMGTDDLGRGNNEESLKTGNAGGRAACGVIGIAA